VITGIPAASASSTAASKIVGLVIVVTIPSTP